MMTLPVETAETIKATTDRELLKSYFAALRNGGWTLESIAAAAGISRERVRQLINMVELDMALGVVTSEGLRVPEPPTFPEKVLIERPEPLAENVKRMRELQYKAQSVRANSPRYREEAEEYTKLIAFEHLDRGVSLYKLASVLEVTHGALRFRLVRYGYKTTTSDSRVYRTILDKNRVV